MLDEDRDTLAAEYVLGTLSAEEREHAEALLTFDSGFEAAVRQWERRLGELNVMVEAVEPPTELWDRIKREVTPAEPAGATEAAEVSHDLDAPHGASDLSAAEEPASELTAETEGVSPEETPMALPP